MRRRYREVYVYDPLRGEGRDSARSVEGGAALGVIGATLDDSEVVTSLEDGRGRDGGEEDGEDSESELHNDKMKGYVGRGRREERIRGVDSSSK
jgi:hypothetical protein